MKSSELMTGNIICCYRPDQQRKLEQVTPELLLQLQRQEAGLVSEEDPAFVRIEPVPLDADLLRSIGLRKAEEIGGSSTEYFFAANLSQIPQTVVQLFVYSRPVAGIRNLLKCWCKAANGDGQNSVHLCDVLYLHQLQNALSLCGIALPVSLEQVDTAL